MSDSPTFLAALPNFRLTDGDLARRFRALGMRAFHDAVGWVHALPYGRNGDRASYAQVLAEQRGTCSTKHALLAALAREEQVRVPLRVGIYFMDETNTPGIGGALRARGLSRVPEAHCVLVAEKSLIDVTFPGSSGRCAQRFIAEREIAPDDIGGVKLAWHHAFVEPWARSEGLDPRAVWAAREDCIAALGASSATAR